jgi:hypothetical protein
VCSRQQSRLTATDPQAHRAGAHRARLDGSPRGTAGGAKHRRQPAGGVVVAAALRRDGVEGLRRDKTRQNTDRRGSNGAGGDADLHRAAAPGDPLDRLGERF